MTKQEFLLQLDELLEEDPGTLTGEESLEELETWESLTVMEFLALVDETFDVVLEPKEIAACETVNDLVALVADHLEDA